MQRSALRTTEQVRVYSLWCAHVDFVNPCLHVPMKLDFSAPTHEWQEGSDASWVGKFCCLQLISSTPSVSAAINARRVFSQETGKLPFILGADFNLPPRLWQDLSMHGGSLWVRKLGASVVIPEKTHAAQAKVKHLTSSIISWCQHSLDL